MEAPLGGGPAALSQELREELHTARVKRQLGYRKLARIVGADRRHLARIERGLKRPSPYVAERLADALGLGFVTTACLLLEAGSRPEGSGHLSVGQRDGVSGEDSQPGPGGSTGTTARVNGGVSDG